MEGATRTLAGVEGELELGRGLEQRLVDLRLQVARDTAITRVSYELGAYKEHSKVVLFYLFLRLSIIPKCWYCYLVGTEIQFAGTAETLNLTFV